MDSRHKQLAQELDRLVDEGSDIYLAIEVLHRDQKLLEDVEKVLASKKKPEKDKSPPGDEAGRTHDVFQKILKEKDFRAAYQRWYSEALRVVEQLLPDRYDEFREHYRLDKKPKSLEVTTYTISDFIHGTLVPRENIDQGTSRSIAGSRIKDQANILASAKPRLHSILVSIEGALEATLLDDELDAAAGLLKAKHLRSAGVVAGVVLERHLKTVAENHAVKLGRKKAQIGNLNDALKNAHVFDNPRWREVQRLGDIRNLCAHDGEREPKPEEVRELIESTERIIKTIF
jgi:hypothetical protein